MIGFVKYAALLMLIATPAHADWLERAWNGEAVAENRAPAITLGLGGVLLVLDQTTLDDAHAAGLSTPDAVRALLERYGQHCSDVIDLNRPYRHLRVRLYIAKRVPFHEAPANTRSDVRQAVRSTRAKAPPDTLSITAEHYSELFIDYEPSRNAECVLPGAEVS
jgi:hypothetical protein